MVGKLELKEPATPKAQDGLEEIHRDPAEVLKDSEEKIEIEALEEEAQNSAVLGHHSLTPFLAYLLKY